MDILDNLYRDLRERFDEFHVLSSNDFYGERFIRIIPLKCDRYLVNFPLLEIIIRIHENQELKLSLVNFKREDLSSNVLTLENQNENLCILIRKLLLDTNYGLCQVSLFLLSDIRHVFFSINNKVTKKVTINCCN